MVALSENPPIANWTSHPVHVCGLLVLIVAAEVTRDPSRHETKTNRGVEIFLSNIAASNASTPGPSISHPCTMVTTRACRNLFS